ncbi:TPA: phosphoribosylanthranilate isomerase [Candidatus Poribacteria bacterium]|nr:phosphoribosylanthranilate isomerase [Candidatus Poribacteria bacterium]
MKVKICGTTNLEDALMAQRAGVDFIGMLVDVPFSERSLSLKEAMHIAAELDAPVVAVLYGMPIYQIVELDRKLRPYAVQLMDDSPPKRVRILSRMIRAEVWKSLFLPPVSTANHGGRRAEVIGETVGRMAKDVLRYAEAGVKAFLIDTFTPTRRGGSGRRHDWRITAELIKRVEAPIFLSGGITPENVAEAIQLVNPYGIDLCSGVEIKPGKRDPVKLRRLLDMIYPLTTNPS